MKKLHGHVYIELPLSEYGNLENPEFVWQTAANSDGFYEVYYTVGDQRYYSVMNIFPSKNK